MKARLRRRVLLAFLSAAVPGLFLMAGAAWFADLMVVRAMQRDRSVSLTHVRKQIEQERERLRRSVRRLAQDEEVREWLQDPSPERREAFDKLVSDRALAADLDLLAIVQLTGTDRGRFVASAHLPGAAGLSAPPFSLAARIEADVGVVHDFVDGNPPEVVPALVAMQSVIVEDKARLAVYGGVRLDRLLSSLATSGQVDLRLTSPGLSPKFFGRRVESEPSKISMAALAEGRTYVEEGAESSETPTRLEIRSHSPDLVEIQKVLRATWLALAVSSLVMAVVVALWLSRRLSRPVRELAEAATRVGQGDLQVRVEANSNDEIGVLGERFNAMTEEISASRERVRRAERVAAWQQVAQRVAHEIKNPLFPMRMSMETLAKAFKRNHPRLDEIVEESTRTVLDEVAALDRIVKEFSELARMPPPKRQTVKPQEILDHLAGLYRSEPRLTVVPSDAAAAQLDRVQWQRALINLIKNGLEAVDATNGRVTVKAEERDGNVAFEVADNGPGIAADTLEKLFTPYFTTKAEGTGLGLSIVDRIAAEHDGRVEVDSGPEGTRFVLLVPVSNDAAD